MFEVSHEVHVAAPPQAVWRVITEISAYASWTRAIVIEGEAKAGGPMNYRIASHARSGLRPMRFEGDVVSVVPERELVWTVGLLGIMGLRFGFVVQPSGTGADVRHNVQFSGFATHLLRRRFTRLFDPVINAVAEDLARRMSKTRTTAMRISPDIRRRKRKQHRAPPH